MASPTTLLNKSEINWVVWGAVSVSVVFWSTLNDPFNAPKSWVLLISSSWLLGWLLSQFKLQMRMKTMRYATIFMGIFTLSNLIALLATDNKFIGLFGAYQRRTGFLEYLGLCIFFLASAYLIRLNKLKTFDRASVVLALILEIYGFAQHFNFDLVKWNNPYNSVFATLGNPDFAAACMAIFLILNFGIVIQPEKPSWLRTLAGSNTIILFIVIIFSQVRQGILVSILGVALILIVLLNQKSKFAGKSLGGIFFLVGILSLFAMVNKGPLAPFFYKISVTFRGDYWRAGWRMFRHNFLFGVGLDRYGANFRKFRDVHQVLRRGPGVVSNAAHNVPLQLAATGGIFVVISYLALTGFILWRGLTALRNTSGHRQIVIAVFLSAWIGYEAQSLISIDNLGIAIWGYVLGGAVVGLSVTQSEEQSNHQQNSAKLKSSSLASWGLGVLALTVSILSFKAESSIYRITHLPAPSNSQQKIAFEKAMSDPLSYGFQDPQFQFITALRLAESGDFELAISRLKKIISNDSKNYDAMNLLAGIYEYKQNWQAAIDLHEKMSKIDPYNSANLLVLGADYKKSGDNVKAKDLIPVIKAIDPNSSETKQALKELG
jgi:O-antigen ligase